MKCPECSSDNSKITDSRYVDSAKKRRRKCLDCNHTWSTYELILDKEQVDKLLKKDDRTGKPWTENNDDELQFLFEEGMTMKEIAEEVGRTMEAVDKRIRRLGLRRRKNISKLNHLLENKEFLKVLESMK